MKAAGDRYILNYLAQPGCPGCSTIDAKFVDGFIEATGAKWQPRSIGAHRCSYLSARLRELWKNERLIREIASVPYDLTCLGFPRWVHLYHLNK